MSRYRLTVLGDSFSVGWGDPEPRGGFQGWVRRFSSLAGLRPGGVNNLARYGATTWHAVQHQLPGAVAGKAPLVVVVIGGNDALAEHRPYDASAFHRNLGTLFDALTGADTTVVTASLPDIPGNLDVSEIVRHKLRRRFAEANEILADVAEDSGVTLLDLSSKAMWQETAEWDPDRLHPGPRLHQDFAEVMMDLIEHHGLLAAA